MSVHQMNLVDLEVDHMEELSEEELSGVVGGLQVEVDSPVGSLNGDVLNGDVVGVDEIEDLSDRVEDFITRK